MNLRTPPQAVEVERHVLGAMLLDSEAVSIALGILGPDDFYRTDHRAVFEAVTALSARSAPTDAVSVLEALGAAKRGQYEPLLVEVLGEVVTAGSIGEHARIVKNASMKRKQLETAQWLIEAAYSDLPHDRIQEDAEKRLFALHDVSTAQKTLRPIREVLAESFQAIAKRMSGEITGLKTGIRSLDKHLGGLQKSDLIILGGRPSNGKTSLGGQIGIYVAEGLKPVAFFECEMKDRAVIERALISNAGISHQSFRHNGVQPHHFSSLSKASDALKDLPFFIDDSAGITPMQIRAKCRRIMASHGLDLIIIDNIQRMKSDSRSSDPRVRAAEVSCALKEIAKEFDVPVLAISHIRRLKDGDGAEPTMSDLQESGNIEQDADIILLMHRPDLYREVPEQERGRTKVIIPKYREGSLGVIDLYFDGPLVTFHDWEDRPQPTFNPRDWGGDK